MFEVKKAQRQRRPLKINLEGLSGSGKTFTALRTAFAMKRAGIGKRIAIADSENESAGLYAGTQIDGETWEFDTVAIPHDMQNPDGYTKCYSYLVEQGFDIIIMDSLTHAWHGAMQMVDEYSQRNKGDKFGGWAQVTPAQRTMLSTLTDNRAHLIATMRVKSEYERVQGSNGKDKIKKVGMKTDQRDGAEYEFDVVIRMDDEHNAHVEKVRGCTLLDGKSCLKPGPDFWKPLFQWWATGAPIPVKLLTGESEILAANTLDELKEAWKKTKWETESEKQHLINVAAKRKAELQAASPPVTSPQSMPPIPTAESVGDLILAVAEATKQRDLILITMACDRASVGSLDEMNADQLRDADAWLRSQMG